MKAFIILITLISLPTFSRTYFYWRDFKPDAYYIRFEVDQEGRKIDKVFHTTTNSLGVENLRKEFSNFRMSLMLKKNGSYSTWSEPLNVELADFGLDKKYVKFRFSNVVWKVKTPY